MSLLLWGGGVDVLELPCIWDRDSCPRSLVIHTLLSWNVYVVLGEVVLSFGFVNFPATNSSSSKETVA